MRPPVMSLNTVEVSPPQVAQASAAVAIAEHLGTRIGEERAHDARGGRVFDLPAAGAFSLCPGSRASPASLGRAHAFGRSIREAVRAVLPRINLASRPEGSAQEQPGHRRGGRARATNLPAAGPGREFRKRSAGSARRNAKRRARLRAPPRFLVLLSRNIWCLPPARAVAADRLDEHDNRQRLRADVHVGPCGGQNQRVDARPLLARETQLWSRAAGRYRKPHFGEPSRRIPDD